MATDFYAGPGDAGDVADFGFNEQAVRLGLAGRRRSDEGSDIRVLCPRSKRCLASSPPGLVYGPVVHAELLHTRRRPWSAGSSPVMTNPKSPVQNKVHVKG